MLFAPNEKGPRPSRVCADSCFSSRCCDCHISSTRPRDWQCVQQHHCQYLVLQLYLWGTTRIKSYHLVGLYFVMTSV